MRKLVPIVICALLPFVLGASMAILSSRPPAAVAGFDATTYGTVLAWYRAEDIVAGDGSSISTWADHSANAYDAVSFGNPPTYKTSIINGHNVVRFDGANDLLATTASFTTNCGTVIAVIGHVTHSLANAVSGVTASATSKRVITFYPDSSTIYSGDGTEFWGSSVPTRVNGASTYTFPTSPGFGVVSQSGTPTGISAINLGNSTVNDPYNGDIVELVFYQDQLSTGNQDAAAAALMSKYGL